jgi:GNAT superfamily N-acetyltransferase
VSDVFVARFEGRPIAVATFGPTHLFLGPRNLALPQFSSNRVCNGGARALNASVRLLQRVIVEPRWRALGVASRLLKATLPQLGVPFVECLAEMGEFSGFLERAGIELRGRCKPSREAARLCENLVRLDLNAQTLIEPAQRERALARLTRREREKLMRQLAGLCRSRIETGAGHLRGLHVVPELVLQRALGRLYCQPDYFLWSQDE